MATDAAAMAAARKALEQRLRLCVLLSVCLPGTQQVLVRTGVLGGAGAPEWSFVAVAFLMLVSYAVILAMSVSLCPDPRTQRLCSAAACTYLCGAGACVTFGLTLTSGLEAFARVWLLAMVWSLVCAVGAMGGLVALLEQADPRRWYRRTVTAGLGAAFLALLAVAVFVTVFVFR
jgi:hypothetical protein